MMDKKDHGEDCRCSACTNGSMCRGGHCCGGHHGLIRWVVKIIVLLIVLWVGIKIGEIKAYLENRFYESPRLMWGSDSSGNGYFTGPGMMRGWIGTDNYATTTPKK